MLYDKYANSNFDDKGFQMQSIYSAIDKAPQYESGKITKEEFDLFKLKLRADLTAHDDEIKLQQQQQQIQTSQPEYRNTPIEISKPVLVSPPRPKQANCTTNGNFTNCTTYKKL